MPTLWRHCWWPWIPSVARDAGQVFEGTNINSTSDGCPSHLYVTCWSVCDRDQNCCLEKNCAWSLHRSFLKLLISWFLIGQRSNSSHVFWSCDFYGSKATLILWLALKKGFDHLIQFWTWSQTLLHGTYKWLPFAYRPCFAISSDRQLSRYSARGTWCACIHQ